MGLSDEVELICKYIYADKLCRVKVDSVDK